MNPFRLCVVLFFFFLLSFPSKTKQDRCFLSRADISVDLPDEKDKIKLFATPKGGATLATQLVFRRLGLLQEARKYDRWIHQYRHNVFEPNQTNRGCAVCQDESWSCIKLVRSPLDRAVSSYFHSVVNHDLLQEPGITRNSTFASFIKVLNCRADKFPRKQDVQPYHFLPQSSDCDKYIQYLLPIEDATLGLERLSELTGVAFDDTGLKSGHYVKTKVNDVKEQSSVDVPGSVLLEYLPGYENYFLNKTVNRMVCCAFFLDLLLYEEACNSSWWGDVLHEGCSQKVEWHRAVCGEWWEEIASQVKRAERPNGPQNKLQEKLKEEKEKIRKARRIARRKQKSKLFSLSNSTINE